MSECKHENGFAPDSLCNDCELISYYEFISEQREEIEKLKEENRILRESLSAIIDLMPTTNSTYLNVIELVEDMPEYLEAVKVLKKQTS